MITLQMPYGKQLELFGIDFPDETVRIRLPAERGRSRKTWKKGRSDEHIGRYGVAASHLKQRLKRLRQVCDAERLMYYYP